MAFKDHFSGHAGEYARYRPRYPAELFTKLVESAPARELAWDCATGSGQAAVALAKLFARVIASDASAEQIGNAARLPNIEYKVETAEQSSQGSASVDLITVGQALHWFDLVKFYAEARRVLKPNGIIAAWCYGERMIAPDIDRVFTRYYRDVVGPYWPPERALVEDGYRSLPFPFERIGIGEFEMTVEWDLAELLGYLGTWSASRRYLAATGRDPRTEIDSELRAAWGPETMKRVIAWPLHLLAGTKN
ncbi:MAG: class I SAM-dependent methyltransferase [Burkholderiales bacterium]|nr:class I SAM-dependent methyltransferase [Burkholderiales bacterium]MDQ3195158.1 class I SAM-dependent methyltransferase [Pseudomonadota bacterium]